MGLKSGGNSFDVGTNGASGGGGSQPTFTTNSITFAGGSSLTDNGSGQLTITAPSGKSLILQSGGTTALTLSSSQNATFAENITTQGGSFGPTGAVITASGGFLYSDRTTSPWFVGNGTGSTYPQMFNVSTTAYALGYGATANTSGSTSLIWTNSGGVVIGSAAIATNATDGFLWIPSCAGAPTGTPVSYLGRVPIVFDSTDGKLYFYTGGAWVGLAD